MKQVFIVTKGDYSSYRVLSVFDKKKDAQLLADALEGNVETWELNQKPAKVYHWCASLHKDGEIKTWNYTQLAGETVPSYNYKLKNFVAYGETQAEAIKNVSDFKAQYLAKKSGIS